MRVKIKRQIIFNERETVLCAALCEQFLGPQSERKTGAKTSPVSVAARDEEIRIFAESYLRTLREQP